MENNKNFTLNKFPLTQSQNNVGIRNAEHHKAASTVDRDL